MINEFKKKYSRWLTWSNSVTALLVIFILLMVIFPGVKAKVILGCMKMGLFRPNIVSNGKQNANSNMVPVQDVEFISVNGKSVNLARLRGKVVFINFWATWCPPCIAEMSGIDALYHKLNYDSSFIFIAADVDGDLNKSAMFLKRHNYDLPLFKVSGTISGDLFSGTLPTTLVINKKGMIVFYEKGAAWYETKKFEDFLRQLVVE